MPLHALLTALGQTTDSNGAAFISALKYRGFPPLFLKVFGDPLETIWKNCIFGLCGVNEFHRRMFAELVTSTVRQRNEWLDDVAEIVNRLYPKEA
jgi:hypothetical protein